jgi:restriction system protein
METQQNVRTVRGDGAALMPKASAIFESDAGRERRPDAWCEDVFRLIEWRRSEAVVEALFAQAGFETRAQAHGSDGGVDIWLYSKNHAGGRDPVSIVQCKHWLKRDVGVQPVRELRGVMAQHGITRGQFVTTSRFTSEAQAFGRQNGIGLLNVDRLLRLIAEREPAQQDALLAIAFEGNYRTPTCARCGIKLVERRARSSGQPFWGCRNYSQGCRSRIRIS